MCTFITCLARVMSRFWSCSSFTMKIMSKRDRIVGIKSMFSSPFVSSHRPKMELAAASTEQREFSVVVMPAFAIEIVCCSIASWIATRSSSFILSNSSIQTTPPSASTIAPPSMTKLRVAGSRITDAVRPAALEPLPEVYTAIGATFSTNLSSCDLAVPGSPSSRILMSPRRVNPSGIRLRAPPNNMLMMAFLMSCEPKMLGAKLSASVS
uniref:Uncharacterized protein n=1 Tax=Anopheles atroparvus TaxID=41427 RepID=A0AAG5CRG8_ANOAO